MTQAAALAQYGSTGVSQGFKNRIINGSMVIDQRNAGASVTNGTSDSFAVATKVEEIVEFCVVIEALTTCNTEPDGSCANGKVPLDTVVAETELIPAAGI